MQKGNGSHSGIKFLRVIVISSAFKKPREKSLISLMSGSFVLLALMSSVFSPQLGILGEF
jgi:hypothetical protein